jgi:quercetin dioxygenase-like cupin family protein
MKHVARAVLVLVFGFIASSAYAQADDKMMETHPAALKWADSGIPGFRPGMMLAVISGDPAKEGPYVIRLKFPAGYRFPGHWHPGAENLTVLSGNFRLGMGEKTDATKLKTYRAGDFLYIPANMAHFGGSRGVTVIQLHGNGPFGVTTTEEISGAKK